VFVAGAVLASTALLAPGTSSSDAHAAATAKPPAVRHVFVIALENQSYVSTFGNPSADPYLASTLPSAGALLTNYYGTGHESNDNYVSIVSGQPPNSENQSDCQIFDDSVGTLLPNGVAAGQGCVYPTNVASIGNQLTAKGLGWKAYEGDMGNDPAREAAACGHPALNTQDTTQSAEAGDGYATRHDPFVYFHSVIDNRAYCDAHVVALGSPSGAMPASALPGETGLATDLQKAASTRRSPSSRPTCATTAMTTRVSTSPAAPPRWPTSTAFCRPGCRRSRAPLPLGRTACSRSPSTSQRVRSLIRARVAARCRDPTVRSPASPARAVVVSGRSSSRRSSSRAR